MSETTLNDAMRVAPTQLRAKARVDSILEAARMHYEAVGRDRFNLDGVAELTDPHCSKATIYRYFRDRVALLDALLPDRDEAEEKLQAIRALIEEDAAPEEKWHAVVDLLQP